ncbi:MAG: hypothetical protein NWF00_04920 [Candidatus Bathyarchaeota archaeon]|nr:hypothetical protein [Candidatus Bathyarchaeota archaeon]
MSEPAAPSMSVILGAYSIDTADIQEILVHLGCSKEVSSFEVKLQNWNGKYSPGGAAPLSVGIDGSISLGRGANCPLIITGHVEKVLFDEEPVEHYVTLSGRCWGERLFRRTYTGSLSGLKGEAIVKTLLDSYSGLSHNRGETELVEDTDTTFNDMEYADSPVWDILKYVAEGSDKAGVIGFDFRVAPDGKFEFFPKLSKVNGVNLVDALEVATPVWDISRIRNKVAVFGLADKSLPADKVSWTRSTNPSDGVWTATSGLVSTNPTGAPDGGACIKLNVPGPSGLYYGGCVFTLNAGSEADCDLHPVFDVQLKFEAAYSGNGTVDLFDVSGKKATKQVTASPDEEFHVSEAGVGSAYANQWEQIESGFDWTHVKQVRFSFYFPESTGTGSFFVHALYFGGRRYSAVVEDAASQAAYGLREYAETDEELWSDEECERRALSLLDYMKDPAEGIFAVSTVIDYGTSPILGGDKVHVEIPNINMNGDYRVDFVEYRVYSSKERKVLELTLQLGKESPRIADYLYGLRAHSPNVEKLSRTKLGRRGIPVVASGCGVGGRSYFNSNVEVDKTSPVFNLLTSRVLKAAFGFDGANTYVATYTGDLILRAASRIVRPFSAELPDDLGCESFPFGNAYINALCRVGWLNIGAYNVISSERVLQNVTLGNATGDASIITSGQVPLARMPQEDAGLVLESQGIGYWPMYVDPDYRYMPALHYHNYAALVHTHAAVDINSGVLAEARVPNVYTGVVTFQAGIITNSVNCANWQLDDAIFANGFRMTESEKLGFLKGIAFLNSESKTIMVLSGKGDLYVAGKIKQGFPRKRRVAG